MNSNNEIERVYLIGARVFSFRSSSKRWDTEKHILRLLTRIRWVFDFFSQMASFFFFFFYRFLVTAL